MGQVQSVQPVKLFIGVLYSNQSVLEDAKSKLLAKYGAIDFESDEWPFTFTNYYSKEMGTSLLRKFLSFERLINPEQAKDTKIYTNDLENNLAHNVISPPRPINLDPGYINLSKVILTTTKDYSHRIYLGGGIYGEVTLTYRHKNFIPWEWTYPDYQTPNYIDFFSKLRSIYKKQLHHIVTTE